MKRLHATRRGVLGALVGVVVALTALGAGGGASAVEDDGAVYTGSYGSRAGFKKVCDGAKGTFIDDGDGNLECHLQDGGWTECDAKGGDCWYTPPPKKLQTPGDTVVEPGSAVADDPGGWPPAPPVTDRPTQAQALVSVAAPEEDREQDQGTTQKGKKGKQGKKAGKRRK
jgi:hypothetical protein